MRAKGATRPWPNASLRVVGRPGPRTPDKSNSDSPEAARYSYRREGITPAPCTVVIAPNLRRRGSRSGSRPHPRANATAASYAGETSTCRPQQASRRRGRKRLVHAGRSRGPRGQRRGSKRRRATPRWIRQDPWAWVEYSTLADVGGECIATVAALVGHLALRSSGDERASGLTDCAASASLDAASSSEIAPEQEARHTSCGIRLPAAQDDLSAGLAQDRHEIGSARNCDRTIAPEPRVGGAGGRHAC